MPASQFGPDGRFFALRTVRLRDHGPCLGSRTTSTQHLVALVETLILYLTHRSNNGKPLPIRDPAWSVHLETTPSPATDCVLDDIRNGSMTGAIYRDYLYAHRS